MKKIKNFFVRHRVLTILMAVALVCLVIICTVLAQCFYIGNGVDKYGNRLDGIEEIRLPKDKLTEYEASLIANDMIKSAKVTVTGKIVYVKVICEPGKDLIQIQGVVTKSLEKFSDDEKKFYDFHFTLKQDKTENSDGFLISGARNSTGKGLVWNNNNPVVEDEEESED